MLNVEQVELY